MISSEAATQPLIAAHAPVAERDRASALLLACDRVLTAMHQVESLPSDASGALLAGHSEPPVGMILVERNRVCWCAAAGMQRRLRDILCNHASRPLDNVQLDALFVRCREQGRPLGEALVEAELVTADQLRAALKQHTVESLLAIDRAFDASVIDWPLSWVGHERRSYNPGYTFAAGEVLAAVGALTLDATTRELITDHVDGLRKSNGSVVVFAPNPQPEQAPLFLDVHATPWLAVNDLLELAEWATAALEASAGFSPVVAHACARAATGGAVAWMYEQKCCAAVCPDGESLQRLVGALDNQSLAMVLATRSTVLERMRERMHEK